LRVALVGAVVILLIWILSDVVLLIFFAILLAAMLDGIASWLHHRTRLPEHAALAIVTVAIVVLACGLAYWVGPRFADEGKQLWNQMSGEIDTLSQRFGSGTGHLMSGGGGLLGSARGLLSSTLGVIGSAFVVLAAAVYFAIAPEMYRDGVVSLFPLPLRPRVLTIMNDIGHTLQWWLLGQAVDMLVVGVLSGVGLVLLGIPLALALAVVAALLTFVPYFGPIVSGIPAVVVALTISWHKAFWVVGLYIVCHGVEGYLVAPYVQRRTVALPPALTVLSMAIFGTIYGVLGIIIATPLMAALLVIVREGYVRDVLGDTSVGSGTGGPTG
jgi:predicted PurR-regulated permease PerM